MNKKTNKKSAIDLAKQTVAGIKKAIFSSAKGKAKTKFSKIRYRFEVVEDEAGQSLFYPVLEVGAPVTVGTESGGESAQDGWYAVDGAEIRVENGEIAEIVKAEASEEFDEVEEVAEVADEVIEAIEQCIAAIAEVQAEVAEIHEEVAEVTEAVTEAVDAVAEFKKQPFSKSVTKDKFSNQPVDNRTDLARFLASKKSK